MIIPWSAHFTEILDWIGLPTAVVVFEVVDGVVVEVVVVVDVLWVVLVVVVVEVDCVGGCASPPWPVGERWKPSDGRRTK